MAADRRRDTGNALTEIRTARSRAESALAYLAKNDGNTESERISAAMMDDGEWVPPSYRHFPDPDAAEMIAALEAFVASTEKWAKKARPPGVVNKQKGY